MKRSAAADAYREELTLLARVLVSPQPDVPAAALASGSNTEHLRAFALENFDKRVDKLRMQLEFVAGAFRNLEDLLHAYCRTGTLAAYDTSLSDGDRFLAWLEQTRRLTPRQRDHVACQRARHVLENRAQADRRGHLRFQEMWSVAALLCEELETNAGLRIHLNPVRTWARFTTRALLDEEATLPADVLFFASGDGTATAVLEPEGRRLVEELERLAPCTLDEWTAASNSAGREEIVASCRDLSAMGLVAFR